MKKTLLIAAAAVMLSPAAAMAERSGEEVYNTKCSVCHVAGIAGAPKFGDAAAWAPRAEKGIDALLATAITGIKAMPPKGTCADCSDSELKSAIQYMLDAAK
ncbi:c-type cytochrome [Marinobacterium sediminicola]|uniref:Cytochrome c5 n=1 Tax=Marinobacterium sediminicola TaxID=518898 RepID=A0ABY1S2I8_9GAMM|nr:c-type cytochrome [Marinobacterium sediminicola]ULG69560.1 c-type cytochrome [Marinobacterium sediminicola]SMR75713.1 Cytochrome c5 [Marinobacterium sediminicola]